MTADHYDALGVAPHAGRREIRAAYLRLMREHHPDVRPGDPAAADRARRANAAWYVLGNAARRASYDRARASAGLLYRGAAPAPRSFEGAVAYSAERSDYRRRFSIACLRVAGAVCLLGTLLLLVLSA